MSLYEYSDDEILAEIPGEEKGARRSLSRSAAAFQRCCGLMAAGLPKMVVDTLATGGACWSELAAAPVFTGAPLPRSLQADACVLAASVRSATTGRGLPVV